MVDVSELLALTSERVGRALTRLLSGENQKNGVISEFISSRNVSIFFRRNSFIIYHLSLTVALIVILKKTDCQG